MSGLLGAWWRQSPASGSCAATSRPSGDSAVMRGLEPGQRGDRGAEVEARCRGSTVNTNSPSGPDATPTPETPAVRLRPRLKVAMLATLTRPTTTTRVVTRSPAWRPPDRRRRASPTRRIATLVGADATVRPSSSSSSPLNAAASASAAAKSGSVEASASALDAGGVDDRRRVLGAAAAARPRPRQWRRPRPRRRRGLGGDLGIRRSRLDGLRFRRSTGSTARPRRSTPRSPARSGGSGIASAMVAMRVGSCSASRRSKKASISAWNVGRWSRRPARRASRRPRRGRPSRRRALACARRSAPRSPRGSGRSRPWTTRGSRRRRRRLGGGGRRPRSAGRSDLLDGDLRIGDEARHGLVARGLRGGLHRLAEVGHELGRPAGAEMAVASVMSGVTCSSAGWVVRRGPRSARGRLGGGSRSLHGRLSARVTVRSPGWSVSLRSAVQGSLKPGRVSVWAMVCRSSYVADVGRVGPMSATRGASWQRGSVRCSRLVVPAVRAGGTAGRVRDAPRRPSSATMGAMERRPHLRRPPRADRYARPGHARPAHLGHRSLQLPLHLLHAEGGLRPGLRVPAARPGPDLRGDRAGRPGVRLARRREAADHRRRAARPARPAGPHRDARRRSGDRMAARST